MGLKTSRQPELSASRFAKHTRLHRDRDKQHRGLNQEGVLVKAASVVYLRQDLLPGVTGFPLQRPFFAMGRL